MLAEYYLHMFAVKTNTRDRKMSKEFLDFLQKHSWKGNIRELKNVMERAVILSDGQELTVENLPADIIISDHSVTSYDLAQVEKLHIQKVLAHTGGNKSEAARLLGIGAATLYRKLEEYKLG